jgi:hypothetical protein
MRQFRLSQLLVLIMLFLTSCVGNTSSIETPTITPKQRKTGLPTYTNTFISRDPMIVPVLCTLMDRPYDRFISGDAPIILSWGWEAKTEDQITEFIENNNTIITFDDEVISEGLFYEIRKKAEGDMYEVIWARDMGLIVVGTHKIIYNLQFTKMISDGINYYGPGTTIESMHDECRIIIY